jgi:hypothetical protein
MTYSFTVVLDVHGAASLEEAQATVQDTIKDTSDITLISIVVGED